MPIHIRWYDDEQTTIYFAFETPWTWEEFINADDEAGRLALGQTHMVYAIFDFYHSKMLPQNAISNFVSAAKRSQSKPNQGLTVVIGASNFVSRIAQVAERFMPAGIFKLAKSLEEALLIIQNAKANPVNS